MNEPIAYFPNTDVDPSKWLEGIANDRLSDEAKAKIRVALERNTHPEG